MPQVPVTLDADPNDDRALQCWRWATGYGHAIDRCRDHRPGVHIRPDTRTRCEHPGASHDCRKAEPATPTRNPRMLVSEDPVRNPSTRSGTANTPTRACFPTVQLDWGSGPGPW